MKMISASRKYAVVYMIAFTRPSFTTYSKNPCPFDSSYKLYLIYAIAVLLVQWGTYNVSPPHQAVH
jgi:hypothetical protein